MSNFTGTQPVPVPQPAFVLVEFVWCGGDVRRPCTALAPRLPRFLVFQLEGMCQNQRLLERQDHLFFPGLVGLGPGLVGLGPGILLPAWQDQPRPAWQDLPRAGAVRHGFTSGTHACLLGGSSFCQRHVWT